MNTYIRRMELSDVPEVKRFIDMILFHKSMQKTYEANELTIWSDTYTDEILENIVLNAHAFLLREFGTDRLLASGFIDMSPDGRTSHIGMVFSDPEYRKMGFGKQIVDLLEQDEFAKKTGHIVIGASLPAFRFYQKRGYQCINGEYDIVMERDTCAVGMEKFL